MIYVFVFVYVYAYVYVSVMCVCICICTCFVCVWVWVCVFGFLSDCINILTCPNTLDIHLGQDFIIRQASAEEVSAVYQDLSPEAQANLKEALAALHKAWNGGDVLWHVVGRFPRFYGNNSWTNPATSSFPNHSD